jgi:hypothetical protein
VAKYEHLQLIQQSQEAINRARIETMHQQPDPTELSQAVLRYYNWLSAQITTHIIDHKTLSDLQLDIPEGIDQEVITKAMNNLPANSILSHLELRATETTTDNRALRRIAWFEPAKQAASTLQRTRRVKAYQINS